MIPERPAMRYEQPSIPAENVNSIPGLAFATAKQWGILAVVCLILGGLLIAAFWFSRIDNKDSQKQYMEESRRLNSEFVSALKAQTEVNQGTAVLLGKFAVQIDSNTSRIEKQGDRLEYNEKQVTRGVDTVTDNNLKLREVLQTLKEMELKHHE